MSEPTHGVPPSRILGGTGSPGRIFARVPREEH